MRRTRLSALLALTAFSCASAPVWALQTAAPATAGDAATAGPFAEAIESGRARLRALMEEEKIPGMSVAIGHDGALLWSEGIGYADVEREAPVTTRTRFRLGSVSKILTAACVLKLVEEERLDLDLPVQEYARSFPDKGAIITPRMLAGHLGGIRHYGMKDFGGGRNIDRMHFDTVTAGLVVFQNDELVAPPGTKFSYSTFGFSLLSAVVEGAAETDFLTYLQATVLDPLGMEHTAPDERDVEMPDRTGFYEKGKDGALAEAPYLDPSYKWAGGGIVGTAEDLVRFGTAHLAPGFLDAETLELAFTHQHTTDGEEVRVGIGWFSDEDAAGRRRIFHNGSQAGCRALLLAYRDEGVVIALLSNLSGTPGPIQKIGDELAEPFLAELAVAGK